VQFWDFPDSQILNTPELQAKIAETITELAPDVVITLYSGPEWAPGAPNQRDHIEFSNAVAAAYDSLSNKPQWFFGHGPHGAHGETVDDFIEAAVASLAAHEIWVQRPRPVAGYSVDSICFLLRSETARN
jgi:LmbE family N-acetylglucosaminyl deacetylase